MWSGLKTRPTTNVILLRHHCLAWIYNLLVTWQARFESVGSQWFSVTITFIVWIVTALIRCKQSILLVGIDYALQRTSILAICDLQSAHVSVACSLLLCILHELAGHPYGAWTIQSRSFRPGLELFSITPSQVKQCRRHPGKDKFICSMNKLEGWTNSCRHQSIHQKCVLGGSEHFSSSEWIRVITIESLAPIWMQDVSDSS